MPNLILDLMVDRVDLVDEGANSQAFIKLYKRKETEQDMTFEEILAKMKPEYRTIVTQEIEKAKAEVPETVTTELSKAKKDLEDAESKLKAAEKQLEEQQVEKNKDKEPDFEEVMKGLDPAVQEVFKSLKAQKEAAEEVARQQAEKALTEEAVAKAKELKALPVEEDKLVDIMKGISPEVHEILKAANQAIIDGGLFEEIGKSKDNAQQTSTDADQAWAKIEKKAQEIVENEKISKAKAIAQAVKENPDLYREYLKGGAQ